MIAYFLHWERDPVLAKGTTKGRPKDSESHYVTTILCNNSKEAIYAFEWLFYKKFIRDIHSPIKFCDGVVTMRRMTIDSRGFTIHYLYMEGVREPISLTDIKRSYITAIPYSL